MPTITAARIYKGQKKGQTGEEENLTFDEFPYAAFSRAFSINGYPVRGNNLLGIYYFISYCSLNNFSCK